jgi:hypothetical protein
MILCYGVGVDCPFTISTQWKEIMADLDEMTIPRSIQNMFWEAGNVAHAFAPGPDDLLKLGRTGIHRGNRIITSLLRERSSPPNMHKAARINSVLSTVFRAAFRR